MKHLGFGCFIRIEHTIFQRTDQSTPAMTGCRTGVWLCWSGSARQDETQEFGLLLTKYRLGTSALSSKRFQASLSLLCSKAPFCFSCGPRSLIVQHEIWICSNRGGSAEHYRKIFIVALFAEGDGLILLPDTIRVGRIRHEEDRRRPGVCLLTGAVRSHPITADPAGKFLQR